MSPSTGVASGAGPTAGAPQASTESLAVAIRPVVPVVPPAAPVVPEVGQVGQIGQVGQVGQVGTTGTAGGTADVVQPLAAPVAEVPSSEAATGVGQARGTMPVPAPAPVARAAEAGVASASAVAATDERAVTATLEGYRAAYNQLNAASARVVWPSVDVGALTKAFDQLESQEIEFTSCRIDVAGDSASAVCGGRSAYVPKVGSRVPRRASREWRFALRRSGERWVITRMDAR